MKISEIEDLAPRWMQLIPIQSWRQLASVLTIYALGFAACILWVKESGDDSASWSFLLMGFVVGSFPILLMALPQRFRVDAQSISSAERLMKRIDELLVFRGFRNVGLGSDSQILYVSKLPAFLSWRENQFTIRRGGATIMVLGPRFSISWLHKRVVEEIAERRTS